MQVISANPGTRTSIVLETKMLGASLRSDPDVLPMVLRVVAPDHTTLIGGYPLPMTRLDVGLFVLDIQIPTGATAIGSFIVDVVYKMSGIDYSEVYQVVVNAPYANFSVSTR
jgi:hypothetical protein